MEGRVFEKFQKKPRVFKVPKKPKSLPKVSKRVLNLFRGKFFQKKCYPSVPWRLESSKTFKKIKKTSKFQKCPKSFPKASKRVLNVFWGEFFENFFAQCSMECRVFETFQKNSKNFQNSNQKRTKPFPKESKSVLKKFWGKFFEKFLPSFPWSVESSKLFKKKSKNFQNSNQKRTKPFPKESKSVLNMFWGNFFEKILPSFPWGVESSKIFKKKQRIFKVPKKPKIVTKSVQTCFELVLGQIFPKKMLSQCSLEARVFENFQKNQKNFKIPKMPKIVPKSIQTCFERVLRRIFRKLFCPVFHGWSSLRNFSKKIKKFSKFQPKTHKTVLKRIQKCFEHFLRRIFRKLFCPVFHGWSSLRNFSKKIKKFSKFQPKTHKTVPKRIQKCFEHVLGQFFRKVFAQFSMGGRVFENFQKKQRIFKVPKKPKIVTKSVQTCFELVLGQIFPKKMLSQCSLEARVFENFQKNQKNFKIPKMPKIVPKSIQTCFERVLRRIFRKLFCPVFHGWSSLRNFSKKIKKFSKFQPKTHKNVLKRIQKCFEHFLGQFFRKIFAQFSMEGRVFENFQKNQKN